MVFESIKGNLALTAVVYLVLGSRRKQRRPQTRGWDAAVVQASVFDKDLAGQR